MSTLLVQSRPALKLRLSERHLFIALLVLQVLPLLVFRYFPNWDGPSHLAAADIIAHYHDPAQATIRKYFMLNVFPSPNLTGHILLSGFMMTALPAIWAEKLLVGLILVLTSLSIRYALLAINSSAIYLSYLGLPFAIGWFVHAGQYNFCIGVGLFFFSLGYVIRNRDGFTAGKTGILSLLLMLCYFSHIISIVMTLLCLGLFTVWLSILDATNPERLLKRTFGRALWSRSKLPLAACLPALALLSAYAFHPSTGEYARFSPVKLIFNLLTLVWGIVSFSRWEYLPSTLLSLTILGLSGYALMVLAPRKPRGIGHPFGAFAVVTAVLYFTVPDAFRGGSFLSARLGVFIYFGLLLWLGQFALKPALKTGAMAIGIVVTTTLIALHIPKYVRFNDDLKEYLSFGPRLEKNATILPLFYIKESSGLGDTATSLRTRPLDTSAGYLMAEYNVIDLAHYESAFNYFATEFRPEIDPFRFIGSEPNWQQNVPPAVNFLHYSDQTSGQVDYVWIWGMNVAPRPVLSDANTQHVRSQLETGYQLVFVSKPRGLLNVYKRRALLSH